MDSSIDMSKQASRKQKISDWIAHAWVGMYGSIKHPSESLERAYKEQTSAAWMIGGRARSS